VGAFNECSSATGVNGDQNNNDAVSSGAAYVFLRTGQSWTQKAYLKASNTGVGDLFGFSVAVSGETAVVGADFEGSSATGVDGDQGDDSTFHAGAAYAFDLSDAECFLVIGDGPGNATFFAIGHLFETQVGPTVEEAHAVLMEDIPEFVLPGPDLTAIPTGMGITGVGTGGTMVPPTLVPSWMWDGNFTVQVLLWNPDVFAAQPEQSSFGLMVHVRPGGSISTFPYGTGTGITVWAETDVNEKGQPVVRFPFSIPGI